MQQGEPKVGSTTKEESVLPLAMEGRVMVEVKEALQSDAAASGFDQLLLTSAALD